jgi:hypothetical protein
VFIARLSVLNGLYEFAKLCYLLARKPYPYTEKILQYLDETSLGRKHLHVMRSIMTLMDYASSIEEVFNTLETARGMLLYDDQYETARQLSKDIDLAMLNIGIKKEWVANGYDNIDQFLCGELGPIP